MKNGDFIRNMDNDRLAYFLFNWSINVVENFREEGGKGLMNPMQLKNWLDSTDFKCIETNVDEGFGFNDDFTVKAVSE